MEKGESVVSIALTALLVLMALGIQRRWNASTFRSMASSAENFVLESTGLREGIPSLAGYERVRKFWLGQDRAALYRATPSPLVFAAYRFVIYNRRNQPVFKTDSVEASTRPWTVLYDFNGRHGLANPRARSRSVYIRDLSGDGKPDVLLGQYSGGDHCCTTLTVIELDKGAAQILGRIGGLDGLPFEGVEVRRVVREADWQLIIHRPYRTVCGLHADAADVVSVYAYKDGHFLDQTARFSSFLDRVLEDNLAKWKRDRDRSLHLLQTLTVDYSAVGQPEAGEQFFQQNLPLFLPQLRSNGVDPQACIQDMANLVNTFSSPHRT